MPGAPSQKIQALSAAQQIEDEINFKTESFDTSSERKGAAVADLVLSLCPEDQSNQESSQYSRQERSEETKGHSNDDLSSSQPPLQYQMEPQQGATSQAPIIREQVYFQKNNLRDQRARNQSNVYYMHTEGNTDGRVINRLNQAQSIITSKSLKQKFLRDSPGESVCSEGLNETKNQQRITVAK